MLVLLLYKTVYCTFFYVFQFDPDLDSCARKHTTPIYKLLKGTLSPVVSFFKVFNFSLRFFIFSSKFNIIYIYLLSLNCSALKGVKNYVKS